MSKHTLRHKHLKQIKFPEGKAADLAVSTFPKLFKHSSLEQQLETLEAVLKNPEKFAKHENLSKIADALIGDKTEITPSESAIIELRKEKLSYVSYGQNQIEHEAIRQMETALSLPVSMAGALMADAHSGYGLPIGGVLAVDNAVIPFGVGMDIGCRMALSIFDLPENYLARNTSILKNILVENTRFGNKTSDIFETRFDDPVMEDQRFKETALLKKLHGKAYQQLGTSGSGNHFVEFGEIEITEFDPKLNLQPGKYIGLLSHSGSRGLGAEIAQYYTNLAVKLCKLPKGTQHLAYFLLNTAEGQEYWNAMNLAGEYAEANHRQIHRRMAKALHAKPLAIIENHHNFAWKEQMPNGQTAIIHRKGATPAGLGVLGFIPGSMATPGFLVRGKGNAASLNSASHGAGRLMSRADAKNSISKKDLKQALEKAGVSLLGGDMDEAPQAYKNIFDVMNAQKDLVEILGTFNPKIVRMEGAVNL